MKDIDNLAAAIVKVVALIIAVPLKTGRWALKAALHSLKALSAGASHRWHQRGSKKSQPKAAKTAGSPLDRFKMWGFEDMISKHKKGGKNVERTPR